MASPPVVPTKSSEPLAITMLVTGLIIAIIQALRAFGTSVTPEQETAIIDLVSNLISVGVFLVGVYTARSFVMPTNKAAALAENAYVSGKQEAYLEVAAKGAH